ncbi:UDP-N-acetyl-alpha-D-glucosamine C6 dehydratase [BD1-7 clade bacterium]|uniref:UDP-N-acetyl-alpha-D-glucosamine C6 dehydratase n=1 Tax=BD1-7 clade bacterium TaxID=2029982 RepID=A0A5S9N561_9GAMM|nr:UDP-N-acetyl-alpha-D-glucosamine C6 dehydratase [BD1-7 clade bacterium]CAA0084420.1 UDP-N-acetyl-alpha-D-glucosamine C6 dehydratase [BD1-7 clade bacterium]
MRQKLTALPRYQKRIIAVVFDVVCVWLCFLAAMMTRLGSDLVTGFVHQAPVFVFMLLPLSAMPFFVRMGLYRAVLRCMRQDAMWNIVKAAGFATLGLVVMDKLLLTQLVIPRSVPLIYCLYLATALSGTRYLMARWLIGSNIRTVLLQWVRVSRAPTHLSGRPVVLVGDIDVAAQAIEVLDSSRQYMPQAVIDIQGQNAGGEIAARKIYQLDDMAKVVLKHQPAQILLTLSPRPRKERRRIIKQLEVFGLPIKTIPCWRDITANRVRIDSFRDIDIADVLERDEVPCDPDLMAKNIDGRVVLITGAGGSIGAELSLQVLRQHPAMLIVVDQCEYNLYQCEQRLTAESSEQVDVVAVLLSTQDQTSLVKLMQRFRVETVFHAAAYKHVPMVEHNVIQGLANNLCSTISVAQAAVIAGVGQVVLVSSDKAVRPTNVMGASKRLSELYLQALNHVAEFAPLSIEQHCNGVNSKQLHGRLTRRTHFVAVRFGNVLGSSGSVVPLFKQQIEQGGPVTVTHPEITRYFMTIPEAARLVIQAGALAAADVYVLDMGKPVRIVQLAERLIRLSGLTVRSDNNPEGDVDIVFTGLRDGEKLYEELLIGNDPQPTPHPGIFCANEQRVSWQQLMQFWDLLSAAFTRDDEVEVRQLAIDFVQAVDQGEDVAAWLAAAYGKRDAPEKNASDVTQLVSSGH